ncbi:MAG TPA: GNAT family N-acetyltransferase [Yeosuana sp.]
MIRKGNHKDINRILKITKACTELMIKNNIFQWNAFYPNENAFEKDAVREELYVIEVDSELIGCVTISTLMDEEYIPVSWLAPNIKNLYIHRLAVHPEHQGKGYAQQLISFAETYAISNEFNSIRLDTFSKNLRNQKFYELRGYKRLEEIRFPNQSEHPFYCYELVL